MRECLLEPVSLLTIFLAKEWSPSFKLANAYSKAFVVLELFVEVKV